MKAIIDADSYIYVACYSMEKGFDLNSACNKVDALIERALNKVKATSYLIVIGRESFRKFQMGNNNVSDYKAQRRSRPDNYDEIASYILDRWEAYLAKTIETDDVCCILQNELDNTIVISPDKDLRTFSGKFYDSKKDLFENISHMEAEYRFWKQMLTGDIADNVKGISGIGDKKASAILENKSYVSTVYEKYQEHFGEEARHIFYSNMYLLTMLRTYDQADQYGLNLRNLEFKDWS